MARVTDDEMPPMSEACKKENFIPLVGMKNQSKFKDGRYWTNKYLGGAWKLRTTKCGREYFKLMYPLNAGEATWWECRMNGAPQKMLTPQTQANHSPQQQ